MRLTLDGNVAHDVDVVIDRLTVQAKRHIHALPKPSPALLNLANGVCSVVDLDTDEEQLFSMHAYSPKSGLSYSSLGTARLFI